MAEPFDKIENVRIHCLLNRKIDDGRYLLTRRLADGGHSVVYLGTDLHAWPGAVRTSKVAVKCLLHRQKARIRREVELHKRAASLPGVVKISRTIQEDGLFFVVLEYCPFGDLFTAISEKHLSVGQDDFIKNVFVQLIDTVAALHDMGIFHRDLKPENVLLCAPPFMFKKQRLRKLRALLSDFGVATTSEHSENFGTGSHNFMTPECLAGTYTDALESYSTRAADIWALGVILVNLVSGRFPWERAMLSDSRYQKYCVSSNVLRQTLPISYPAFRFLDRIFRNHGNNIKLSELRKQFLNIDTLYMTAEEIAVADKSVRIIASKWMPNVPLADVRQEDMDRMGFADEVDKNPLVKDKRRGGNKHPKSTPRYDVPTPSTSADGVCPPAPTTAQTSAESDFPITPETKPVQPTEAVPDLPKGQRLGKRRDYETSNAIEYVMYGRIAQVGPGNGRLHI